MPWCALRPPPRHEKRVHLELQEKSIESFLPLLAESHSWSDRQQVVQVPLFPGYVFTRTQNKPEQRVRVLRTAGVVGFVGFRGIGVSIPEEQISAIQSIVEARLSPFKSALSGTSREPGKTSVLQNCSATVRPSRAYL